VSVQVFRERYVQPVPTLNYSAHAPTVETGLPHIFVANTSQIINDTLNNNVMTSIARKAAASVIQDLKGPASDPHRTKRALARSMGKTLDMLGVN